MKQADRRGARYTVIVEEDEQLVLRDMSTGEQRAVDESSLIDELRPGAH